MRVRQQRVHRMAHLVGQREGSIERVVVVEQHVRIHAVHRRRVRAAAIARVLVDVNPATRQHLAHLTLIVGAKERHRRRQPLHDLLVGILGVVLDERNHGVVRVVGLEAEHALAQSAVPAQRLGARLGGLNQILDNRGRNVVAMERRLERRRVAAGLREKPVALENRVIEGRVRIEARLIELVILGERGGAVSLVAIGRENGAVLPVRQHGVGARRETNRRTLQVGRRERRIGVIRS